MDSILDTKCYRFACLVCPVICLFFLISTGAVAEVTPMPPPQLPWWQAASGILAIPGAIIGLAYSYVLGQEDQC
jgi:hypothetical protein